LLFSSQAERSSLRWEHGSMPPSRSAESASADSSVFKRRSGNGQGRRRPKKRSRSSERQLRHARARNFRKMFGSSRRRSRAWAPGSTSCRPRRGTTHALTI